MSQGTETEPRVSGCHKVPGGNHGSAVDIYFNNLCEAKRAPAPHEVITDCSCGKKASMAGEGFRLVLGYGRRLLKSSFTSCQVPLSTTVPRDFTNEIEDSVA